jgi:NTP pyrophosphatase (non-canonical NTP hydrolase)
MERGDVNMKNTGTPEFQDRVARFVAEHDLEAGVEIRLLDLLSELGEVAKEVLKGNQYGTSALVQTEAWEEELADVFFALICLANTTGVDLNRGLQKVLEKYALRVQTKGNPGSI